MLVVASFLPSLPLPCQAVLSSDKLQEVIAKAKAGDSAARESLHTDLLYYEMLEGSPGLMNAEETRSIKLIRAALAPASAPSAFPPALAPSTAASTAAARGAAQGSLNSVLSATPNHNAIAGNDSPAQIPDSLIRQGEELLRQKHYDESRRQFEQAFAVLDLEDPRLVLCLEQLGRLAVGRHDLATARRLFTKAVQLADKLRLKKGPAIAEAYLGLGLCLIHDGDKAQAIKTFRKGLKADPNEETRSELQRALGQAQRREEGSRSNL
jgi:tetratricopeptide (TPR) repeat protein